MRVVRQRIGAESERFTSKDIVQYGKGYITSSVGRSQLRHEPYRYYATTQVKVKDDDVEAVTYSIEIDEQELWGMVDRLKRFKERNNER